MPPAANFWQDRAARHGHTGWGDQTLYAYDQLERQQFVTALLDELDPPATGGVALDFGCGTGDFSRLLLERGYEVYGYDPFVASDLHHPRFTPVDDPRALTAIVPPVHLVLSVTVLDHILDDLEFGESIDRMHHLLAPDGRLVLVEYAPDDPIDDDYRGHGDGGHQPPRRQASSYQAFRSFAEWRAVLEEREFVILDSGPVPHPIDSPSAGYLRYRGALLVRAMKRLRLTRRRGPQRVLRTVAHRALEAAAPCFPHEDASPLRYMVCGKAPSPDR